MATAEWIKKSCLHVFKEICMDKGVLIVEYELDILFTLLDGVVSWCLP